RSSGGTADILTQAGWAFLLRWSLAATDAGCQDRNRPRYNGIVKKFWDNAQDSAAPGGLSDRSVRPIPARVPSSVQIGPVTISPATVLAPMAGVTDTVF